MKIVMPRIAIYKTTLAIGLTLTAVFFAQTSQAQSIVEDPIAIEKAIEEYVKEAERWEQTNQAYINQAQHYIAQAQFWEQQLIKLQRLDFSLVQMQVNFQERSLDYGIDTACPGSSGGLGEMIDGVFQQLIPQLGEDIPTQQLKLCQKIVVAKNSKYNATVDLLGRLAQYQQNFQKIETQRISVNMTSSQGALASNDNEALRFIARMDSEVRYWQTDMAAYDQYIDDLKDQQTVLAKHAMKGGQSTIWGQVVDAVALKAAFSL